MHFARLHRPAALTAALLLLGVGASAREAVASGQPLTLASAVATALIHNPTLKTYSYEIRVAEARVLQAGIRPAPELSVEAENFLGTGSMSGVQGLETTLQLSKVIDLGGSIDQRVATAQSARALADADYEIKRLEVLAEVGRRFIRAAADADRLEIARRSRKNAASTVAAIQKRVAAAIASPIDLAQARSVLGLARIAEQHATHELAAHRRSLAAALGLDTDTFGPIRAKLLELPETPGFKSLAEQLENSPVLARYAIETRWHTARIALAHSLRYAGTTFSGGLRRNEASDSFGLVAGLSIPLAFNKPRAGEIREARARRDQTAAAAEAQRLEMRATLYGVYQEMLHASNAVHSLRRDLIPAVQETLQLAEEGYNKGRYPLLYLLDARKSLLQLEQLLVDNAATYHLHLIELERLLGAPLSSSSES